MTATRQAASSSDQVILTCALTGAVTSKKHCPAIPYTPLEIAEEAQRAYEAGAAVVHIHAREDSGQPSYRVDVYRAILEETRRRCPVLINFSTGAIGLPMEQRVGHVTDLQPEIAALNMGSMNYAKYNPEKKKLVFDLVFSNPFEDIIYLLRAMNSNRVKPELECFDTGQVGNVWPLLDMGVLVPPLDFSLILGVLGGIPASARNLAFQAGNLPPGSSWKVIGISREQWMLAAAALSLGGNVRVGLEDNFYLPSGKMASSNGELVTQAVALARAVGREPATVDQARQLLSLAATTGTGALP